MCPNLEITSEGLLSLVHPLCGSEYIITAEHMSIISHFQRSSK